MRFLIGCLFTLMVGETVLDDPELRRVRHAEVVAIVESLSPASAEQAPTDLPEGLGVILAANTEDDGQAPRS